MGDSLSYLDNLLHTVSFEHPEHFEVILVLLTGHLTLYDV